MTTNCSLLYIWVISNQVGIGYIKQMPPKRHRLVALATTFLNGSTRGREETVVQLAYLYNFCHNFLTFTHNSWIFKQTLVPTTGFIGRHPS